MTRSRGLKPGMSAEVTIVIDDQLEHVLSVPLQAIVGSVELGKERKCFVLNSAGQPEERTIVVGLSNEQMAEIKSGVEEGDEVVLNPKALLDDKDKTALSASEQKSAGHAAAGAPKGAP